MSFFVPATSGVLISIFAWAAITRLSYSDDRRSLLWKVPAILLAGTGTCILLITSLSNYMPNPQYANPTEDFGRGMLGYAIGVIPTIIFGGGYVLLRSQSADNNKLTFEQQNFAFGYTMMHWMFGSMIGMYILGVMPKL